MDQDWFIKDVRNALNALYNPKALRDSPLVDLFGLKEKTNPGLELQQILLQAIELLRPGARAPSGSKVWRLYQILRKRYTEQIPQPQAAHHLGLSVRQLQREEKLAREELTDRLWARCQPDSTAAAAVVAAPPGESLPAADFTRRDEIEYLRGTFPAELIQIGTVLEDVFELLTPLLEQLSFSLDYLPQDNLPPLLLQEALLKQGLLEIFSAAVQTGRGGLIQVRVDSQLNGLRIQISLISEPGESSPPGLNPGGRLELASQLIQLCAGHLEAAWAASPDQPRFSAAVWLPVVEQVPVMVVDDNGDTLQLYRRYLTGSRYAMHCGQDTRGVLEQVEQLNPCILVLDVMMRGQDGWAILGQLRAHPKTHTIPVLICTILQQEQLALSLGAAGFLRKPFSRAQFLGVLDQLLAL